MICHKDFLYFGEALWLVNTPRIIVSKAWWLGSRIAQSNTTTTSSRVGKVGVAGKREIRTSRFTLLCTADFVSWAEIIENEHRGDPHFVEEYGGVKENLLWLMCKKF